MHVHFWLWEHITFGGFFWLSQTDTSAQSTASCLKLRIFQTTQVNKGHNSVLKTISPAIPSVWDSPQQSNTVIFISSIWKQQSFQQGARAVLKKLQSIKRELLGEFVALAIIRYSCAPFAFHSGKPPLFLPSQQVIKRLREHEE